MITPEDIERAEIAADDLYDSKRGMAAIVILADLRSGRLRVIARAPNSDAVIFILATATTASDANGRVTAKIGTD